MPKIAPARAGACFGECLILQVAPPEIALIVTAEVGAGLEVSNAEDSIIQTAPPAGRDSWQKVMVSRPPAAPFEFFRIGGSQEYYLLSNSNHRP